MSIFKKTIKYSNPSKDLNEKIKNLDEGLKQTGVISSQNDSTNFCIQESVVENLPEIYDEIKLEEDSLYDWRKSLLAEDPIEILTVSEFNHKNIRSIENRISESNQELIQIRDKLFQEISEKTLLNLPEIKIKIEKVLELYDQIHEGLLNEPPKTNNEDPLTPLDQNFITPDDLNKHYSLFINRIQEQLSTFSGGGETKLKYLDDVVGIATNPSFYDGKYLKYDHSIGKFEFVTVSGVSGGSSSQWETTEVGIHTLSSVGIATTNPQTPLQVETYGVKTGSGTFSGSVGVATDIDTFVINETDFKTAEYTLHFTRDGNIQAQKVLIMQNGSTAYSQEYAVMYDPSLIVSVGATVSSGICKLQVTPELGMSGLTTYRFIRNSLL